MHDTFLDPVTVREQNDSSGRIERFVMQCLYTTEDQGQFFSLTQWLCIHQNHTTLQVCYDFYKVLQTTTITCIVSVKFVRTTIKV